MDTTKLYRGDTVLVAADRLTMERARVLGYTGEGLVRILPDSGAGPRAISPRQIIKIFKS